MTYLDDELADATDALLEGREELRVQGENRELYQVVRQLCAVIDPQSPPSAAFERRLQARLQQEWSRDSVKPTLRLMERPVVRVASLAAAFVLVLGALLVLAVPEDPAQLEGAAIGSADAAALVVLVGVAAVGALYYWRSRE